MESDGCHTASTNHCHQNLLHKHMGGRSTLTLSYQQRTLSWPHMQLLDEQSSMHTQYWGGRQLPSGAGRPPMTSHHITLKRGECSPPVLKDKGCVAPWEGGHMAKQSTQPETRWELPGGALRDWKEAGEAVRSAARHSPRKELEKAAALRPEAQWGGRGQSRTLSAGTRPHPTPAWDERRLGTPARSTGALCSRGPLNHHSQGTLGIALRTKDPTRDAGSVFWEDLICLPTFLGGSHGSSRSSWGNAHGPWSQRLAVSPTETGPPPTITDLQVGDIPVDVHGGCHAVLRNILVVAGARLAVHGVDTRDGDALIASSNVSAGKEELPFVVTRAAPDW